MTLLLVSFSFSFSFSSLSNEHFHLALNRVFFKFSFSSFILLPPPLHPYTLSAAAKMPSRLCALNPSIRFIIYPGEWSSFRTRTLRHQRAHNTQGKTPLRIRQKLERKEVDTRSQGETNEYFCSCIILFMLHMLRLFCCEGKDAVIFLSIIFHFHFRFMSEIPIFFFFFFFFKQCRFC